MNITKLFVAITLCILLTINSYMVSAQNTEDGIFVEPRQCVSLNQGNICYGDVTIKWQLSQKGNYCLYSSQHTQSLACWESEKEGSTTLKIATDKNIVFTIKKHHKENPEDNHNTSVLDSATPVLASATLELAWVYKKNKRGHSRWRMF